MLQTLIENKIFLGVVIFIAVGIFLGKGGNSGDKKGGSNGGGNSTPPPSEPPKN